jgi:alginate O-acetyltransferase complex protein AlgI
LWVGRIAGRTRHAAARRISGTWWGERDAARRRAAITAILNGVTPSAMIFFSYYFALFAVTFFALYWALPWRRVRRWLLLAACVTFHAYFAGPAGVLPIIFLASGTYLAGRSRDRRACIGWIAVCVSALCFYKYANFLSASLIGLIVPDLGTQMAGLAKGVLPAAPPLAISFFTFEFVHYLIEVYRGHRPIKSLQTFALFAVFWPTLVAGPIKRYRQFVPALGRAVRNVAASDLCIGAMRVGMGIVKKFVADNLTAWISYNETLYDIESVGMRWVFLVALGARILLDFSGYSDMAIGFARMMGIRVMENFRWPYLATSISDFWRRWHISLSSWIRDYVYIPLGGSRAGAPRRALNALVAMSLCGLWHGAAWNFVLWGIYHGCGLIAVTAIGNMLRPAADIAKRWRLPLAVLCWSATVLFVHFGWLLFFYPAPRAFQMFLLLFETRA